MPTWVTEVCHILCCKSVCMWKECASWPCLRCARTAVGCAYVWTHKWGSDCSFVKIILRGEVVAVVCWYVQLKVQFTYVFGPFITPSFSEFKSTFRPHTYSIEYCADWDMQWFYCYRFPYPHYVDILRFHYVMNDKVTCRMCDFQGRTTRASYMLPSELSFRFSFSLYLNGKNARQSVCANGHMVGYC